MKLYDDFIASNEKLQKAKSQEQLQLTKKKRKVVDIVILEQPTPTPLNSKAFINSKVSNKRRSLNNVNHFTIKRKLEAKNQSGPLKNFVLVQKEFNKKDDKPLREYDCHETFLLTMKTFSHVLKEQPDVLHLAMHGTVSKDGKKHFVSFDEIPILRQLLSTQLHPFSAYFATISIFIEDEINKFIKSNQRWHTITIKFNDKNLFLFNNPILGKLLTFIAQYRFGCYCKKDVIKKCFIITFGIWGCDGTSKKRF